MDTLTCGLCLRQFGEISDFLDHKKSHADPDAPAATSSSADPGASTCPMEEPPAEPVPVPDHVEATSSTCIWTCKLCNLFALSKAELHSHLKSEHADTVPDGDTESFISQLMPLSNMPTSPQKMTLLLEGHEEETATQPGEALFSNLPDVKVKTMNDSTIVVPPKKKRGRPRKKPVDENLELRLDEEKGTTHDKQRQAILSSDGKLVCDKCNRMFARERQYSRHRCMAEETRDEDEMKAAELEEMRAKRKKVAGASTSQLAAREHNYGAVGSTQGRAAAAGTAGNQADAEGGVPELGEMGEDVQTVVQAEGITHTIQQSLNSTAALKPPYLFSRSSLTVFSCEFCSKVFKFRNGLVNHLRVHTKEKPFKCDRCDYACAVKTNLKTHMRKHTGERFHCQQCDYSSINKGHLKDHIATKHKGERHPCEMCSSTYTTVRALVKHFREKHDPEANSDSKEIFDKLKLQTRDGVRDLIYICDLCNRKFKTRLDKERHVVLHQGMKPFPCGLCEYSTNRQANLDLHIRKHKFIYNCCACEEHFLSSIPLTAHLQEKHVSEERSFDELFAKSLEGSKFLFEFGNDVKAFDFDGYQTIEVTPEGHPIHGQEGEGQQGAAELLLSHMAQEQQQETVQEQQAGQKQQKEAAQVQKASTQEQQDSVQEQQESDSKKKAEEDQDETTEKPSGTDSADSESKPEEGESTEDVEDQDDGKTVFDTLMEKLEYRKMSLDVYNKLKVLYGDMECRYCGRFFYYDKTLAQHERTHTGERPFACNECPYASATKEGLKRHIQGSHSKVLIKCEQCEFSTNNKYTLWRHTKKEHAPVENLRDSYTCPACSETFTKERAIKVHIKKHHPAMTLEEISLVLGKRAQLKSAMGQRAFKCPYCGKLFRKKEPDLRKHIWAHEGIKPFKCGLCTFACRSKSNLKAHMLRHTKEKNHLCEECGKKFKTKQSLKFHSQQYHNQGGNELKRYYCQICDYSGIQIAHLRRHMEQHSGQKVLKCPLCPYSCNITGAMKRHFNKKHPGKAYEQVVGSLVKTDLDSPTQVTCSATGTDQVTEMHVEMLKCPECDFVFGNRWDLNKHLQKRHEAKVVNLMEVDAALGATHHVVEVTESGDGQVIYTDASVLQTEGGDTSAAVNILQQIMDITQQEAASTHVVTTTTANVSESQAMVALAPDAVVVEQAGGDGMQHIVSSGEGERPQGQEYIVYLTQSTEAL
ncbi:zinc finger protein ZFAT-like isoform X2 [Branchiostoma floridae]|uniref:Zinc finger protein ZFAT-like isoform X2 n=1 Tax=Branchiostoma floridae TaxID=7739 RepID=A0A9J7MUD6_BRAFL|nr:zinc finger protein ZFAT-like isoform X2 [Branchiostoma floridae]